MVIFNHLPRKHLLRGFAYTVGPGVERDAVVALLTSPSLYLHLCCSTHLEKKREGREHSQRDNFQHLLHFSGPILSSGSGKRAACPPSSCQLLKCWPHIVSCEIPGSAPRKVLLNLFLGSMVMVLPSCLPQTPSMCLYSDLGLPEVKEKQGKGEVTQTQANSRLYIWRGGRHHQYMFKIVPNLQSEK